MLLFQIFCLISILKQLQMFQPEAVQINIHSMQLFSQSCPVLCDPTDRSPSGSSFHGIFQVRIPQWVAISSSRRSSWPKDQTHISYFGRWILYPCATWEAHILYIVMYICQPQSPIHFTLPSHISFKLISNFNEKSSKIIKN